MQILKFYQGEVRPLTFKVTLNNKGMDLSGNTLSMVARKHPDDSTPIISKVDTDFDKLYESNGIVSVPFNAQDTAIPGVYKGQLKILNADGTLRKTDIFFFEIEQSVDVAHLNKTGVGGVTSTSEITLDIN